MNKSVRITLREDGAFAIETHCVVEAETYKRKNYKIIYADSDKASHCVWIVPGTTE